uniref:Protein kinase domain-containing protein n=4 Tax=Aegilops tauschii subsp. strangulata TaxID=200361 RepID=A0A452XSI7_AEGTS
MGGYEFQRAELDALEGVVRDPTAEPMSLTLPLLRHITNDFSHESRIGRGGFAVVYLGVLPSGLRIAVKRLSNIAYMNESAFQNEVFITMKATHKNTVRFMGYCSQIQRQFIKHHGRHVYAQLVKRLIFVEYAPKGTLDAHIGDYGELDWNQRYQILKGICQDMFEEEETERIVENIAGTFGYMAPEFCTNNMVSFKAEIYSLGVVIGELLIGKKGWFDEDVRKLFVQQLKGLRKTLVKEGAFSSWENKYHQVRTCMEIGQDCIDPNPHKRPTLLEIIQRLNEAEDMNYSAASLWQSGDEESDLSDTEALETETTSEFLPSDEEPASVGKTGETSTQEPDKPDLVSKLPASVDLSDLKVLEKITDDFSHERIVGKDGTFKGCHKAFVYKGDIPRREMIAVKRLIGVEIPVEKFKREAEQFIRLDHKNIVKVASYCHDQSRGHRLVQFKGKPLPQLFNGPEQLLCYEYMHNGSLRDYLMGQGSREIDWQMRYKLIKGTCAGLDYLHKGRAGCPIVHLNLSPSNVLLDHNYIPRITGFDFSKLIGEKNTKSVVLKLNGPIAYLPPDFFHSKGTDLKYLATVDIYSLGLMILEIATQQEIKGIHGVLIKSIEENWREESQITRLYTSLGADELRQVKMCIDIGLDCVKSNPEKRPTAGAIMDWLNKESKPVPVSRAGAGVLPRPPVPTNINHAGRIQGIPIEKSQVLIPSFACNEYSSVKIQNLHLLLFMFIQVDQ